MIQTLVPEFHYKHAESYVALIEDLVKVDHKTLSCQETMFTWSNPIMVMCLNVDILYKLKD